MKVKVVYKITYPNGKIYIGQDVTGTLTYFGSPKAQLISADFSPEEQVDFTIRKQILWQSSSATAQEVNSKEIEMILEFRSNNPAIGYNIRPKHKP